MTTWAEDVQQRLLDEPTARALQAAGVPHMGRNLYADEADRRDSMMRRLQATLPRNAGTRVLSDPARVEPRFRQQFEDAVREAALKAASQSPVLRPVVTLDRSGREITEFFGKKRGAGGWLEQYCAVPQLMTGIGGHDVCIPVVL